MFDVEFDLYTYAPLPYRVLEYISITKSLDGSQRNLLPRDDCKILLLTPRWTCVLAPNIRRAQQAWLLLEEDGTALEITAMPLLHDLKVTLTESAIAYCIIFSFK